MRKSIRSETRHAPPRAWASAERAEDPPGLKCSAFSCPSAHKAKQHFITALAASLIYKRDILSTLARSAHGSFLVQLSHLSNSASRPASPCLDASRPAHPEPEPRY